MPSGIDSLLPPGIGAPERVYLLPVSVPTRDELESPVLAWPRSTHAAPADRDSQQPAARPDTGRRGYKREAAVSFHLANCRSAAAGFGCVVLAYDVLLRLRAVSIPVEDQPALPLLAMMILVKIHPDHPMVASLETAISRPAIWHDASLELKLQLLPARETATPSAAVVGLGEQMAAVRDAERPHHR